MRVSALIAAGAVGATVWANWPSERRVLWEAESPTDLAIAMAEPIETVPNCDAVARSLNIGSKAWHFCLPEGVEP